MSTRREEWDFINYVLTILTNDAQRIPAPIRPGFPSNGERRSRNDISEPGFCHAES